MFKKVLFHCDRYGKPLGKTVSSNGINVFGPAPFTLNAVDCNAKEFYLSDTSVRTPAGEYPGLHLVRALGPLTKDPYNEDGRPPTVLLTIVMPHVSFCSGLIEVTGLEEPNLCWAGSLIKPYTHNYKLRKGVRYLSQEEKDVRHFVPFWEMNRQKIILAP